MQRESPQDQAGSTNLYAKLVSLGNEEVDELDRLRKTVNVMEVKIDDIYNHLLSSKVIDPRKTIADKLNLLAVALLTVGLVILSIGIILPDDSMLGASAGISVVGLLSLYISIYFQSSRRAKGGTARAEQK